MAPRYTTKMPAGWRIGRRPPKPRAGYKTGRPGPKSPFAGLYVTKPVPTRAGRPGVPRPKPKVKKPKAPAPVPGPYDRFKGTPWEGYFEQQDRDRDFHLNYARGLLPTVSSGLAAITGINPAAPGYNPTIQQQYLANVAGNVGGALNAAATATPFAVGSTSPGGVVAAPNAYQGAAMRQYAAQRGGAEILNAQAQAALNTVQPNIMAQAAYSRVADLTAGLPKLYADRRAEDMLKINQFLAQAEETARHNRVTEAISAQNAKTQAAIAFGQLGLSTEKEAFSQSQDLAESRREAANANAPAPYGYQRDPVTGKPYRDPSVPQASASSGGPSGDGGTSTRDAQGRLRVPSLQEKGYRRSGSKTKPKVPAGWKVTRGADGRWWVLKPGGGGSGSSGGKRSSADLSKELADLYKKDDVGGWEERYTDNPAGAGAQIARWVRENKSSFAGSGRIVDIGKLTAILDQIGGRPGQEARRILVRGYMKKVNGRLVWR